MPRIPHRIFGILLFLSTSLVVLADSNFVANARTAVDAPAAHTAFSSPALALSSVQKFVGHKGLHVPLRHPSPLVAAKRPMRLVPGPLMSGEGQTVQRIASLAKGRREVTTSLIAGVFALSTPAYAQEAEESNEGDNTLLGLLFLAFAGTASVAYANSLPAESVEVKQIEQAKALLEEALKRQQQADKELAGGELAAAESSGKAVTALCKEVNEALLAIQRAARALGREVEVAGEVSALSVGSIDVIERADQLLQEVQRARAGEGTKADAQAEKDEKERAAAAKAEAERKEAERKEAEAKEAERKEAEAKEAEAKEAERKEAERKEAEAKEAERKEAEKKEAEAKEAERKEAEAREAREKEAQERARKEAEAREAREREERAAREQEAKAAEERARKEAEAAEAEARKKAEAEAAAAAAEKEAAEKEAAEKEAAEERRREEEAAARSAELLAAREREAERKEAEEARQAAAQQQTQRLKAEDQEKLLAQSPRDAEEEEILTLLRRSPRSVEALCRYAKYLQARADNEKASLMYMEALLLDPVRAREIMSGAM